MWTNVVSYDCTGADQATLAESDAANDRCVGAHCYAFFDPCFDRDPVCVAASRCQVVSQDCIWTKEDVVGDVYVLPNADAVFDGDVVADRDATFDESVIANVAV